jgi:hypothetical protein
MTAMNWVATFFATRDFDDSTHFFLVFCSCAKEKTQGQQSENHAQGKKGNKEEIKQKLKEI